MFQNALQYRCDVCNVSFPNQCSCKEHQHMPYNPRMANKMFHTQFDVYENQRHQQQTWSVKLISQMPVIISGSDRVIKFKLNLLVVCRNCALILFDFFHFWLTKPSHHAITVTKSCDMCIYVCLYVYAMKPVYNVIRNTWTLFSVSDRFIRKTDNFWIRNKFTESI